MQPLFIILSRILSGSQNYLDIHRFFVFLLVYPLILFPQGSSAQESSPIRIGVLANRGQEICHAEWNPTAEFLTRRLQPLRFEIIPLGFDEIRTSVANRQIDYVILNSSLYVYLEHHGMANRIATFKVASSRGPLPLFGGVILTRSDRNDINRIEDLRGKRFAAVDQNSLGGWHAAFREIKKAGIDPHQDFDKLVFTGSHDAVVMKVLNREVDAGTVRTSQLERMSDEKLISLNDLKIIKAPVYPEIEYPYLYSTRLYPDWPIAAVMGTDIHLSEQVAMSLFSMRPDDAAAIANHGAGWTIPQDYTSVHECLRELHLPPSDTFEHVSLLQVIKQYWHLLLVIVFTLIVISGLALVAFHSRRKLAHSLKELNDKQTELEETTQRLEYILEVTKTGINITDKDFNLHYVDKHWKSIYGDPTGRKCHDYFMCKSSPCEHCPIPKALETKKTVVTEVVLPHENNRVVEVHTIPFQTRNGEWMVAEFNVDVTLRKQSEELIKKRERMLDGLSSCLMLLLEKSNTEESFQQALGVLGAATEVHRVYIFENSFDPSTGQPVMSYRYEWVETGTTPQINNPTLQKLPYSRCPRWWDALQAGMPILGNIKDFPENERTDLEPQQIRSLLVVPIRVKEHFWGFLGLDDCEKEREWLDVEVTILSAAAAAFGTAIERQYDYQKLRNSEEKFRLVFDTSPDAICLTRARDGIFIEVNHGFEIISGYSRSEVLGQTSIQMNFWCDLNERQTVLDTIFKQGFIANHEIRFLKKDGSVIPVLISGALLMLGGEPHILSISKNIEELKRAEEEKDRLQSQLQQAQKMESVGRLAGGVAHDFNNMLQAILGYAEMALDLSGTDPILEDYLKEIQKAASHSADITRQLLAFARKQTAAPKILNLNDTVSGMLKMLSRLIGEDISLSWIPGDNLWSIKVDPSQIDQILANLVVNARDAIQGPGEISIRTNNKTLKTPPMSDYVGFIPGDYVELVVTDNGTGMGREVMKYIFEPFFTTKPLGEGTGLGLATVYGIVRQNEGYIFVSSELGKGSSFFVYFPRYINEPIEVSEELSSSLPGTGTETILFVEDELSLLELGRKILEKRGYHVLTAGSPLQAIRIAHQHENEIQLLVTDVVMPDMSGKVLYERLKSKIPHLRCLFVSGYSAEALANQKVLEEGILLLHKPYTMDMLASHVRKALAQ